MAQHVLVTAGASGMGRKNEELSRSTRSGICLAVVLCTTAVVFLATQLIAQVVSIDVGKMPSISTVDERFQSYNIEMVEVIGGKFWKPYLGSAVSNSKAQPPAEQKDFTPAGIDPNLYQYRGPIALSNPRLRKLAAALGPAYVRVSGTWANSAYFQDSDNPAAANAPSGFSGVLTRKEWKGVVDFSHAVDAEIVTSVATGIGARDAHGVWSSEQARRLFEYTKSVGGRIAATEFMNEPTYAAMGGAPKGYDAAAYGRDIQVFRAFLQKTAPGTVFLGPGSVGEGPFAMPMGSGVLKSEDLLRATGPVFDVFSYHLYAATSQRCASMGASSQTTAAAALSQDWLSRPEKIGAFYAELRDKFEPGKSLWITETADAACGGNPVGFEFFGHVPIPHSTCKPRPGRRESDHAQHAGFKRLRIAGRKHICAATELLGSSAVAKIDGYDRSRSRSITSARCLFLCALFTEPTRWRDAAGHQCRPATRSGRHLAVRRGALHSDGQPAAGHIGTTQWKHAPTKQ